MLYILLIFKIRIRGKAKLKYVSEIADSKASFEGDLEVENRKLKKKVVRLQCTYIRCIFWANSKASRISLRHFL